MFGKIPHENPRDAVDDFGRTKLHSSANNGIIATVKNLLDEGIDINTQDDIGWTALHFAAQNNHFKTIEILLEYHADPNIYDKQGNGPLWTAAMNVKNGNCQAIIALLSANADPDHANHHGRTPRYIAKTLGDGIDEAFARYAGK
ncbi:MAG: ankyrin repeat domain-containing protein [Gammaproteobacteria bacterium]|nr:ankyrin repeat domain-containing protein [Gammaproteobacteria bacterium]